ncbi:MAG: hypothetical protein AB7G11_15050 [Phycisphaerales bacterium]
MKFPPLNSPMNNVTTNRIGRSSHSRGSAAAVVIAILAGGTAVTFATLSLLPTAKSVVTPIATAPAFTPPTSAELSMVLYRLGLSPDHLAAAGVSPAQTTELVGDLRSHLTTAMDDLRDADSNYAASAQLVDSLERVVRAGTAAQEDLQALTAARSQLASSAATRQTLLASALSAATADLDPAIVQSLALARSGTIPDVRAGWNIPLQYAFADRPEEEWVHLRDALSSQRISARHGEDPAQDALDTIAAANSSPAVAAASANLQANLNAVSAAWNNAVSQ